MLTRFVVEDPLKARLEWLAEKLMRVEAGAKVGVPRGKRSQARKPHFSGFRVRMLNSRLGTLYLMVPKVRQSG